VSTRGRCAVTWTRALSNPEFVLQLCEKLTQRDETKLDRLLFASSCARTGSIIYLLLLAAGKSDINREEENVTR